MTIKQAKSGWQVNVQPGGAGRKAPEKDVCEES